MFAYETIKLFDLAQAPIELRDSRDLQPLRPETDDVLELPLLWFRVEGAATSEAQHAPEVISLSDYLLNRWLLAQGVTPGETVILTWRQCAEFM